MQPYLVLGFPLGVQGNNNIFGMLIHYGGNQPDYARQCVWHFFDPPSQ